MRPWLGETMVPMVGGSQGILNKPGKVREKLKDQGKSGNFAFQS